LEIGNPEDNVHLELLDIPVYRAMPPKRDLMMDVIRQLVSTLNQDRMARQSAAGSGCPLKDFCIHNPNNFDKNGDHINAKNWLNDMEELLTTTGCTNGKKVLYTSCKLIGEAKHWWQDEKVVLVTDLGLEAAITWDIFKHKFDWHFFPRVIQG
jgi:hypothetical protein